MLALLTTLVAERCWLVKIIKPIFLVVLLIHLNSCGALSSVVSSAANAGISSKGFSASVDDSFLKAKIIASITNLKISNLTDITVNVSLGDVLLTGYCNDQLSRLTIVQNVIKIDGVRTVYNEIKIESEFSMAERAEDVLFESRLMTRLLFKSGINSNNFRLDVFGGSVYIIGLAEDLEEKIILESFLEGMNDIPKLITIINIKR